MKAHRHHSPRTAIILILISVLSFAFVACDASKKCYKSYGIDKEACEKACSDKNGKYWEEACHYVCNDGENLSACSRSCKEGLGLYRKDCKYVCDHGDTAACELDKEYREQLDAFSKHFAVMDAWRKEEAEKKEKEACHVTTWQLIGDVPNQSISNFSWRSASISIPEDAAIECAPTTGFIERFQTAVELGERPNPALLNRFSKELLKCGKAIGSNELVEVAKKCNGKWY